MKKLSLLLPFIFILAACAPMDQLISTPQRGTRSPAASPVMQATQPANDQKATPMLVGTPTLDYRAAEWTAQAEHDNSQLTLAVYDLQKKQMDRDERSTEIALSNSQMTQGVEKSNAQGTQLSIQSTNESIHATGTTDGQDFIKSLPTINAAQTQVGYTMVRDFTGFAFEWVGILVVCALVSAIIFVIVRQPAPKPAQQEEKKEAPLPAPQPSYWVKDPDAEAWKKVPPPPGGITEKWLIWANIVRTGTAPSYDAICVAGSPYPNSNAYKPIYTWAYSNILIARDKGGQTVLTRRGELVLDNELAQAKFTAGPPPLDDFNPLPAHPTSPIQDNPAQDSGGGVVGDDEKPENEVSG